VIDQGGSSTLRDQAVIEPDGRYKSKGPSSSVKRFGADVLVISEGLQ